jgi:hypothetical protein
VFICVDWLCLYTLIGRVCVRRLAVFIYVDWPCLCTFIGSVYILRLALFMCLYTLFFIFTSISINTLQFTIAVHRRSIHWLLGSRSVPFFGFSFETLELTCPDFVNE